MSRFIVSPHAQGTPEWKADRLGKVTGSAVAALYAKVKSGEAAARADYRVQLVLERLTGTVEDMFTSKEMEWGTNTEGAARLAYEAESGLMVREAGFCSLPKVAAGSSVDGFIDSDDGRLGILEVKCPKSKTHLGYLDSGEVPTAYNPQVLHNMWITGAQFADFMSYDPRFPRGLQRMTVRVERSEAAIRDHEALVLQFLLEVDALEKQLRLRAA